MRTATSTAASLINQQSSCVSSNKCEVGVVRDSCKVVWVGDGDGVVVVVVVVGGGGGGG